MNTPINHHTCPECKSSDHVASIAPDGGSLMCCMVCGPLAGTWPNPTYQGTVEVGPIELTAQTDNNQTSLFANE